jgi:ribokinase
MAGKSGRVTVLGSLNIDYIASVEKLPGPGETVCATGVVQRFGGKGANQAVAAARQGARVAMIGCVGVDDAGRAYLVRLRSERIATGGISTTKRALTGTALIGVDCAAENLIIVARGANGELRPGSVSRFRKRITSADVLLMQFEIPRVTILEAMAVANRAGVRVVLNPSPTDAGFPWGQFSLHTVIVNEGEAETIAGLPLNLLSEARQRGHLVRSAGLVKWRAALERLRIGTLIVTRGAKPTVWFSQDHFAHVPTLKVKPVDTVGAGDAFAGAFAARLAEGASLEECIRAGNCAGALATLKPGAQESIPSRALVDKALRSQR